MRRENLCDVVTELDFIWLKAGLPPVIGPGVVHSRNLTRTLTLTIACNRGGMGDLDRLQGRDRAFTQTITVAAQWN